MRLLWQLCFSVFLACLVVASGCSGHGNQSTASLPVRPRLSELAPNGVIVGSTGTLILRGANFVPGASISTPPGLYLRNVRVNSPAEITADYAIAPNSFLGYLNVTVTTPGGTSEPIRIKIVPPAFQFAALQGSSLNPAAARAGHLPPFESFDVGIHAAQVQNKDGVATDAYLDVSFTDDQGHPVAVDDSYHSDMDNVVSPDDEEPGPEVTSYSFGLRRPDAGNYVLHIKSSRVGSFTLEADTSTSSSNQSLAGLNDIPTYPGSSFELRFVCRRDPFTVQLDGGGLRPAHGAFSFAQPLDSVVQLPSEAQVLGIAIYYDPVMDPSSFRASLDGTDVTSLFHVQAGKLEVVDVPLKYGPHNLRVEANTKSGLSTEQDFRIQH